MKPAVFPALCLALCGAILSARLAAAQTAGPGEEFIRRQIEDSAQPPQPAQTSRQPQPAQTSLPPAQQTSLPQQPAQAPAALPKRAQAFISPPPQAEPATPPANPASDAAAGFVPVPLAKPDTAEEAPAAPEAEAPLPVPAPMAEEPVVFPRFGDRKPHIWASRRKPWHYPVHGTDVSWHNKGINWSAMARGHISFVFIKATEGGDFADPSFMQNWQAAKAAGLARGAYHFYYFCRPAKQQLSWFIRNVPRDKGALPPILDMEWNHTSPTCRRRPAPAEVRHEMRQFLTGLEKHYGKKPIIYTTVDFFRDNALGAYMRGYPFWLRSVAGHPDERYSGQPWLFWQYTGTGRVPGIAGDADISVFSGSWREWLAWLRAAQR